jgi:hypothetical protein
MEDPAQKRYIDLHPVARKMFNPLNYLYSKKDHNFEHTVINESIIHLAEKMSYTKNIINW